jgi:very-short-patch-repair endonuclease
MYNKLSKEILIERADNMRIKPTQSEKAFRDKLELKGIRYKTQVIISKYIVDFIVGKTIYEIDGSSHDGKEIYDTIRDADLRSLGYKVIHIQNAEVANYRFGKVTNDREMNNTKDDNYTPTPLEQIRLDKMKQPKKKFNKWRGKFKKYKAPN